MSRIASRVQADLRQAARDVPAFARTFLDRDYDVFDGNPESPAGCKIWDVGRADAAQHRGEQAPPPPDPLG